MTTISDYKKGQTVTLSQQKSLGVYRGLTGTITEIDKRGGNLTVRFPVKPAGGSILAAFYPTHLQA